MRRREFLGVLVAAIVSGQRSTWAQVPVIDVSKDPTCGCCMNWVAHLEKAGFRTKVTDSADMTAFKDARRIPKTLRSCHTGVVNGYVIEGHVPAADIKRLLAERPKLAGLAVPGMPLGSPGMEVASGQTQRYDVLAFDAQGKSLVYATHGGRT
jgi:hypothetical protein